MILLETFCWQKYTKIIGSGSFALPPTGVLSKIHQPLYLEQIKDRKGRQWGYERK